MVTGNRNAGGVYLGKTGIAKESSLFVRLPDGCGIASHGIGRKIKNISISPAAEQDRMTKMSFQFTAHQIPGDYSSCLTIDDYHVVHLMARIHLHIPKCHLSLQRLVCTNQ